MTNSTDRENELLDEILILAQEIDSIKRDNSETWVVVGHMKNFLDLDSDNVKGIFNDEEH